MGSKFIKCENKDELNSLFFQLNSDLLTEIQLRFKEIYEIHNFLFANRWGSFDCLLCKMTFESESQYNEHEKDQLHQSNLSNVEKLGKGIFVTQYKSPTFEDILSMINDYRIFRPVVFLSILEHNSNALTWRDTGSKIVYVGKNDFNGEFDYSELVIKAAQYSSHIVKIGSFNAASNITGELLNVDVLSIIMHEIGGLAFFDYASGAPYLKIDMNSLLEENFMNGGSNNLPKEYVIANMSKKQKDMAYKDGIFFSPHKFLGGPNTSGVLIIKQHTVRTLLKPADTGGGVVLFVTQKSQK